MTLFDSYRDPADRKLMVAYVMRIMSCSEHAALADLRTLNHVGLAYLYRDAIAKAGPGATLVDYDPCERGR